MRKGVCIGCQLEVVLSYSAEPLITVELCSGEVLVVWAVLCYMLLYCNRSRIYNLAFLHSYIIFMASVAVFSEIK